LQISNTRICIESKNYKLEEKVRTKEIDKFIRDVKNYDCGIICSINDSGFVGKKNFNIEYVDNKPIIYIQDVKNNPNYLDFGISILLSLTELSHLSDEYNIVQIAKNSLKNFYNIIENVKTIEKSLVCIEASTESCIDSFKELCQNDEKYICDTCNTIFKSKKILQKHYKSAIHRKILNKTSVDIPEIHDIDLSFITQSPDTFNTSDVTEIWSVK